MDARLLADCLMRLSQISINCFRNLSAVKIDLDHINILYGANGSGKTSFLESIYFLAMGRSFRSKSILNIISHKQDKFCVFAKMINNSSIEFTMGVEKSITGESVVKINGDSVSVHSELTKLLPIQFLSVKDYCLLEGGSEHRRGFLDYGLFHVEPEFLFHWRKVNNCLKQRNALLKLKRRDKQLIFWNEELEKSALVLNTYRKNYVNEFSKFFRSIAEILIPDLQINLQYYAGWDENTSLLQVLENNFIQDLQSGYTNNGPHRADLLVSVGDVNAKEILSRGQQKILIYTLRLSQGLLFKEKYFQNYIYLIDDLPSELDVENQNKIMQLILQTNSQIIITGINKSDFDHFDYDHKMFHVEPGNITAF